MSDDLTMLTDEERERLHFALVHYHPDYDEGSRAYEVVADLIAARTAALIDRAERAERDRDRLDGELSLARGTFELMRDELAALRAAVTGLADEWDEQATEAEEQERTNISAFKQQFAFMARTNRRHASRLRALLPDEGDNDGPG